MKILNAIRTRIADHRDDADEVEMFNQALWNAIANEQAAKAVAAAPSYS